MPTGAFLIARMSSKRLTGKNMLKILGKPMIELMAERVSVSGLVDKVAIATSTDPSDDPLEKLASKLKIGCHRGSLDNVMERICGAARKFGCDSIVELLGDNPLVHSELIDDVVRFYFNGKYDYAATATKEYPVSGDARKLFSVGLRVQVYSIEAAERWPDYVDYMKNGGKHPNAYIFEHPGRFKVGYFEAAGKWGFMNHPDMTFAVNYRKNFELIRTIFEKNYPEDGNFSLEKVYGLLERNERLHRLMGSE